MEAALRKLCTDVEAAVQGGCEVLILSDRLPDGEEVRSGFAAPLACCRGDVCQANTVIAGADGCVNTGSSPPLACFLAPLSVTTSSVLQCAAAHGHAAQKSSADTNITAALPKFKLELTT